MRFEAQVTINGSRAAVWDAITDIEHAPDTVSGVQRVEVVERPAHGLVGLRWRETRMYFGKPATAEKWITDAAEHEFYTTRAESDGFVHVSTVKMAEGRGGITVTSTHESTAQGLVRGILTAPMGFLFKGVARKAILQDLNDIKSAVERARPTVA